MYGNSQDPVGVDIVRALVSVVIVLVAGLEVEMVEVVVVVVDSAFVVKGLAVSTGFSSNAGVVISLIGSSRVSVRGLTFSVEELNGIREASLGFALPTDFKAEQAARQRTKTTKAFITEDIANLGSMHYLIRSTVQPLECKARVDWMSQDACSELNHSTFEFRTAYWCVHLTLQSEILPGSA